MVQKKTKQNMGKQGTKCNGHSKIKSKAVQMEEHFSENVIVITTIKQSIRISNTGPFAIQKSNSTLDFQGLGKRKEKAP